MRITARQIIGTILPLAVLLPYSHADFVTWDKCKKQGTAGRLLTLNTEDTNATFMDLDNCNIETIEPGSFENLPNLEVIYLYSNKIERIDASVFKPVSDLKQLRLNFNRLNEVPAFGEHSLFPKMKELYLNGNLITGITNPKTFSSCVALNTLFLQSNLIEYIDEDVFKPLKNLKVLHLETNRLRFINDMFQIETLQVVSLSRNLIEYVSPNAFKGTKLKELYLYENKITYLPKNFLSELKSNLDNFWFYNNPWDCSCLIEQLMEIKKLGVGDYYDTEYEGTESNCVYTVSKCRRSSVAAVPSSRMI